MHFVEERGEHYVDIERLSEEMVEAARIEIVIRVPADPYECALAQPRLSAKDCQQRVAVHDRHLDIDDGDIRNEGVEKFETFRGTIADSHIEPRVIENGGDGIGEVEVIIDDEHTPRLRSRSDASV